MKADENAANKEQQVEEKPRQMLFAPEPIGAPTSSPASIVVQSEAEICLELIEIMVGERGFEPPTPWSRIQQAI
jgi:hypothetical protein